MSGFSIRPMSGAGEMIKLNDIFDIFNPRQYKLHMASRNENYVNPLDEYVTSYERWRGWNTWKGKRNDWTRRYILSFMDFYPSQDRWLFGGAFKVIARHDKSYELEEVAEFEKYRGRLLVSFHKYQGMRGRAFYLEKYLDDLKVSEILPQRYVGESFCGFENINHDFHVLEPIFKNEREDWKSALSSVKGIYLICDKSNGKKYVGSAYGDAGIWSRWACYIGTGHGWSDELTRVVRKDGGLKYARENFRFSILDITAPSTPDAAVIARESHWKRVLLTREHGYNLN